VRLRRPARIENRQWYKISNHATTADLFIYDEIGMWGVTASDLVAALADLDAETITVRINSPGGDVFDGIAIYEALQSHPATVNTQIDSLAASAASFIALAGETVTISEFGQMMIHDPYTIGIGNAQDLRETADLLDRQGDNIAAIYAKKAGGSVSDWRAAMRVETWYSSSEAVSAGLADAVKQAKTSGDAVVPGSEEAAEEAMAAKWDLSVFAHQGRRDAPEPYIPSEVKPTFDLAASLRASVLAGIRPDPAPTDYAGLFRAAFTKGQMR